MSLSLDKRVVRALREEQFIPLDGLEGSTPLLRRLCLQNLGMVCAPKLFALDNVTVVGRGHVFHDGDVVLHPAIVPTYWRERILARNDPCLADNGSKSRVDLERGILCVTAGMFVYGHWLLDILPRIWFAKVLQATEDAPIVLPIDTPRYAMKIINLIFGDINVKTYDRTKQYVFVREAFIPSLLHTEYRFHSTMNEFRNFCMKAVGIGTTSKVFRNIYVDRRLTRESVTSQRNMINEREVHKIVEELGYERVFPEDLSWPEQLALFSEAISVVGPSGSGLHNTLFMARGTHFASIRWMNNVQHSIGCLRGARMHFLGERRLWKDESGVLTFEADVDLLRNALRYGMS
jgi:capsular polysaccharide biosynthesis protein